MKKNYIILLLSFIIFGFFSCNDDSAKIDNHVYINILDKTDKVLLTGDNSKSKSFIINMLQPEEGVVSCYLSANESKVADYKYAYSSKGDLLPAKYYSITPAETQIEGGAVSSVPINIQFNNLNELNRDSIYILPITLTSGMRVLDSKSTVYYIIEGGSLINVVANVKEDAKGAKNSVYVDWKDASDMKNMQKFTAEILLYPNSFDHMISTIFGIEGGFLLRMGDAGVAPNQLQVATPKGNHTSSSLILPTGKWTHLALTFDGPGNQIKVYFNGVLKETFETNGLSSVDWSAPFSDESDGKPRCFRFGYSYSDERNFDGYMSECRVWNKVLSVSDINAKDHFYTMDATSDGLIAYWKFNDGGGNIIKDYSKKGNDATSMHDLLWVPVALPQK